MTHRAAQPSQLQVGSPTAAGNTDAADRLAAAMHWRYAVRRFSRERLAPDELTALTEAVRHSPSAYGLQPYELIVVASQAKRKALLPHSCGQDKVVECSHLLILAAYRDIDAALVDRYVALAAEARGVQPAALADYAEQVKRALSLQTPQERAAAAVNQAFLALGTLTTSAALLGIDCCPMSGFDAAGYDEVLGLRSRGLTAAVICTLGRRHPLDASADYPRVRVPRRDWLVEY